MASKSQQLIVSAALNNFPNIQNDYFVGMLEGSQPMSNDDRRLAGR
jgi:hypothetical protein